MFGAVRKGAAPPIGSEMTLHYTPAALPFRMMGGVWDLADGRIADIASYPRLAAAIGQAYRLGDDTYDIGLQFRFPDGGPLRKGASYTPGSGAYTPAAYPLDASEAEVIAAMGLDYPVNHKATMPDAQTVQATITAEWDATIEGYGAMQAAATAQDIDFSTGKKAIGWRYTLPAIEAGTSTASARIILSSRGTFDDLVSINAQYSYALGCWELQLDSYPALSNGDTIVMVIDSSGTASFYLNGAEFYSEPVTFPNNVYFSAVIVGDNMLPADIGKTIGIELITDLSELGTLPEGTTDIYGNAGGSPAASTVGTRAGTNAAPVAVTVAGHALTESEMPPHHHNLKVGDDANTPVPFGDNRAIATSLQVLPANVGTAQMYDAGGGAPHAHAATGTASIDPEHVKVLRLVRVA